MNNQYDRGMTEFESTQNYKSTNMQDRDRRINYNF